MWIRSQNKKYLINCKNLGIRKMQNKYVVALISECADFYTLGSYSSEEKAFKVLDEIQKLTEYLCHKAFQMPSDEDLEV